MAARSDFCRGFSFSYRLQFLLSLYLRPLAGVAQLVEQRIRNARVGSSSLFSGTTDMENAALSAAFSH